MRALISKASGLDKAKQLNKLSDYFKLFNPDTALILARQSLQIAIVSKNDTIISDSYSLLAECQSYLSYFDSSSVNYFNAINYAEKIKSRRKLASYYNGLGIVLYQIGDFKKSIMYMKKAAEIKLQDKDYTFYAAINGNIAGALQRLGNYNEALSVLRASEQHLLGTLNTGYLANLYNSIGSIYQQAYKNLDSAIYYYKKNITLIKDKKLDSYRLAAYANLGEIYLERKNITEAEVNLKEALAISTRLFRNTEKISIYNSLSKLYEKKNDFKTALLYKQKQTDLKDSIFTKEKEIAIRSLETKFDVEKKNVQIKSQELEIQKEKNNKYKIALILFCVILLLTSAMLYFWFNRKLVKDITAAKEKFFVNVMHEVRTPLSMIIAPINLLKNKISDDESQRNLKLIDKNSQRLIELVDQMIDVSKVNNLKYTLNKSVGNLELFIEEIALSYEGLFKEKNISFISEINQSNSLLFFDKDALNKIITNLLSNALKYTREGGEVSFKLNEAESDDSSKILIEVSDNGIGIPKKEQDKLFSRFFRSEKSVSTTKGIGIGLSLVKDLVDAHNGKIWFKSEENVGTSFFVEIIFKVQSSNPEKINYKKIQSERALVLLVEDNEDVIGFVGNLLQSKNYSVLKAFNGRIALEVLNDVTPDLILTDVMMDDMGGLALIKEVKNNPGLNHVPIIVLSAKTSEAAKLEVLSAGAQIYLTKPFIPNELVAVIENQLSLIQTVKNEFRTKVDAEKDSLTPEQRFKSSDPYIQKLFGLIFKHYEKSDLTIEFLADLMATSRSHFQRKVKSLTGYSPSDIIKFIRLEKAKEFLLKKKGNVTEVAYMTGFSTQSYFTRCFIERFNMSPSEIIKSKV